MATLLPDPVWVAGGSDPLTFLWPRWLAARQRLDHLTEAQYELGAEERELFALTDLLLSTPTDTIDGVLTKLRALLELAPIMCGDALDFPWPHIRTVIDSSIRLPVSSQQTSPS